jgi:hypothetical protein
VIANIGLWRAVVIKNHQLGLLFALESNRLVSVEKGVWVQAQQLAIPEEGFSGLAKTVWQGKTVQDAFKRPTAPLCCLPAQR